MVKIEFSSYFSQKCVYFWTISTAVHPTVIPNIWKTAATKHSFCILTLCTQLSTIMYHLNLQKFGVHHTPSHVTWRNKITRGRNILLPYLLCAWFALNILWIRCLSFLLADLLETDVTHEMVPIWNEDTKYKVRFNIMFLNQFRRRMQQTPTL